MAKAKKKAAKKNPRKHYPALPGRGRPAAKKKFTLTAYGVDGKVVTKKTLRTTHPEAERIALRGLKKKWVASVILDDHKRKK